MSRRLNMLFCLVMTAGLLISLPGVMRNIPGVVESRVDDRLRPAKSRLITVWLIGDTTGSIMHLRNEMAEFERLSAGTRVYLRTADARELWASGVVLPDVLLFAPFMITEPEKLFVPIIGETGCREDALCAGRWMGVVYAVPLWLAPSVIAVPDELMETNAPKVTPAPTSLFGLAPETAAPDAKGHTAPPLEIPWGRLAASESGSAAKGVSLLQLRLMMDEKRITRENALASAAVMSLAEFRSLESAGGGHTGFAMRPAVCDRALFAALTNEAKPGAELLAFLLSRASQERLGNHPLFPTTGARFSATDALSEEISGLFNGAFVVPNAFRHDRSEYERLCMEGYMSSGDPVSTLLRLR